MRIKNQTPTVDLKLNTQKTKVVVPALAPDYAAPITLNAVALQTVEYFNHLDLSITSNGQGN